jgi:hypothetical protein
VQGVGLYSIFRILCSRARTARARWDSSIRPAGEAARRRRVHSWSLRQSASSCRPPRTSPAARHSRRTPPGRAAAAASNWACVVVRTAAAGAEAGEAVASGDKMRAREGRQGYKTCARPLELLLLKKNEGFLGTLIAISSQNRTPAVRL